MAKRIFFYWLAFWWVLIGWVLCDFIFSPYLFSQKQEGIRFECFTIEQELSQNSVLSILQDDKGFIWLGTEDGLNRYDGYTFKVYRHDSDDPSSLSSSYVRVIYKDKAGVIWAGTDGGGINKFDREKETFARYTHEPSNSNSLSDNFVWAICEGGADVLWIGTEYGLNRLDCKTGTFTHWFHDPANPNSLSHNRVKALCRDGNGILWVGTLEGGLSRLDVKTGTFTHYKHIPNKPGSLSDNAVIAILIDESLGFWVATGSGLDKFDSQKGIFINYTKKYSHLFDSNTRINALSIEKKAHILWAGAYRNGLYQFDLQKDMVTHYKYKPGDLTSLSSNYIQSIHQDNTGILWVGTDSGLNKFDKKIQKFSHCKMDPGNPNSLCDNKVWSICKDRKGYLWIGTEGGLDRLDRKGNKCIHREISRPGNRRIHSIYEDGTGLLWIGTQGDGLYRFHPKKGTHKHYKHDAEKHGSLSDNDINTICEDSTGTLWIGTMNGLNQFEPETDTFRRYKSEISPEKEGPYSLSNNCITKIYEDHSHVLWIGTRDGLNRFYRENKTFYHWKKEPGNPGCLSNNIITAICEDKKGSLWIGTQGGGLNRFDRETKTFQHFLEKDGLPNKIINGILEDDEGNLWLSTNKGISKFDPKTESFKNYDMRDGLQGNEYNGGAYFKSGNGEMFFGGSNGFNAFYPDEIEDNPYIPPIVITDFQILNEPVKIGPDSPLKQSITEAKEIVLNYNDNVFSFEFAALDFSNPKKNKYLYKMEGFKKEWNKRDSDRRFVTYMNLDPGKYVFRVKGSNNDDVWNEEGASIKIIIIPPFWKTWWFQLLAVLAFAILSYVIINFIRKYITLAGFWRKEKFIGKFKLLDKIGSGGMGTIYKAQDTLTKSGIVALKVLREDLFMSENHRKRFKQEAVIIDQLDHPNIVKIMERGQFEQKLYIVMELLEGNTLAKKIEEEEEVDLMEALDIIIQVADALKKIHSKNIVHRDLKPDNVMLIENKGRPNFVKLLDFGLARTEHQTRITQTGTVLGTLNYMSPEQISHGEFSLASDVYSLGVICYETLTRKIPFPGGKMTDIMRKILNDMPTEPIYLRPDMPAEFNALIMQMIEKESGRRPTVDEVMERLKAIVNGQ